MEFSYSLKSCRVEGCSVWVADKRKEGLRRGQDSDNETRCRCEGREDRRKELYVRYHCYEVDHTEKSKTKEEGQRTKDEDVTWQGISIPGHCIYSTEKS
eukprot:289204-Rhodomonas_salina.1